MSPTPKSNEIPYQLHGPPVLMETRIRGLPAKLPRTQARLRPVLELTENGADGCPSDESKPHELLQFLVAQSGKKAGELLKPVFGQRSHVNEAINGKRPISAEQARKRGKLFSVKPGLFI